MRREDLTGTWAMEREAEWPSKQRTALLASRIVMHVLGTLVLNRKLGRIPPLRDETYQQSVG